MCTNRTDIGIADLQNLVADIISKVTNGNHPFTAFDITKALRDENPNTEIRHEDVRAVVDSLYRIGQIDPNYTRTSTVLKTGKSAFVFHNINTDSTDYPFAKKGDTDNTAIDNTNVVQDEEEIVEITKESRLNIPQRLLRAVGLNVGDTAYLVSQEGNNDSVFLTNHPAPKDSLNLANYDVNDDGSVRVTQVYLVKKFGTASQFYKVTENKLLSGIQIDPVS